MRNLFIFFAFAILFIKKAWFEFRVFLLKGEWGDGVFLGFLGEGEKSCRKEKRGSDGRAFNVLV